MHRQAKEGHRVLICAPFGRDADSLVELLTKGGYDAHACATIADVAAAMDDHTGAILLTEEALLPSIAPLATAMAHQPPWSVVPFILLSSPQTGRLPASASPRDALSQIASNMVVLERPLGSVSLTSAVDAALRTRQKQFEMRDSLKALADSRAEVEGIAAELRLVADAMPGLIGFIDRDLVYRFANKAYEHWFYQSPDSIVGRRVQDVLDEQGFALRFGAMEAALRGEPQHLMRAWPHADGSRRDADIRYLPRRGADGQVDGFYVFATDVTDRVRAAEVLEERVAMRTRELEQEAAARERVEAALRQSQKMEAVGQLTGGIAHDFNNMLTGVIGSMDLIKRRIAAGRYEELPRYLEAASASAERAAALTQRLLAFSRRQSLDSKAIDVNGLVSSLEDLLTRTIGENVALQLALAPDLPPGVADANQLESAVLNLVLNARDAMPDGGAVTVETSLFKADPARAVAMELAPGAYVVVAVSDTGVGMGPELVQKVFDPFFTTKPLGQGTGLGLSMVYGFARQSGGTVRIHTQPGQGASVKIYLPAAEGQAQAELAPTLQPAPRGAGQTVLVVEDDDSVRLLVQDVLAELGYQTVLAREALAALPILESDRAIALMVSDVGLPGMTGRELAEVAREGRPDLPILFITGYAENAAIRSGFLGKNMTMITKPFNLDDLARKVGELVGD